MFKVDSKDTEAISLASFINFNLINQVAVRFSTGEEIDCQIIF